MVHLWQLFVSPAFPNTQWMAAHCEQSQTLLQCLSYHSCSFRGWVLIPFDHCDICKKTQGSIDHGGSQQTNNFQPCVCRCPGKRRPSPMPVAASQFIMLTFTWEAHLLEDQSAGGMFSTLLLLVMIKVLYLLNSFAN